LVSTSSASCDAATGDSNIWLLLLFM
jgi:hypothetical protein